MSVIDLATNAVTDTITGFTDPEGKAINPAGTDGRRRIHHRPRHPRLGRSLTSHRHQHHVPGHLKVDVGIHATAYLGGVAESESTDPNPANNPIQLG